MNKPDSFVGICKSLHRHHGLFFSVIMAFSLTPPPPHRRGTLKPAADGYDSNVHIFACTVLFTFIYHAESVFFLLYKNQLCAFFLSLSFSLTFYDEP